MNLLGKFATLVLAAASMTFAISQEPPQPASTPSATPTTPATPQTATPETKPATKKPPAKRHKASHKRTGKRVVREGGVTDTQANLSPGMPGEQATHHRRSTEDLLRSTDANLKLLSNRQLTAEQKITIGQIEQFTAASRAALTAGDLPRARNLALKAHLLSDDLARH